MSRLFCCHSSEKRCRKTVTWVNGLRGPQKKSKVTKRYQKKYMKLTVHSFCRFLLRLSGVVTDCKGEIAVGARVSVLCPVRCGTSNTPETRREVRKAGRVMG